MPKESASSRKALLAQPVGLDPTSQRTPSVLSLDAATGVCQHLLSYVELQKIVSSLLRSTPRGKPYILALIANHLFVSAFYISYTAGQAKVLHSIVCIIAFKENGVSPQHTCFYSLNDLPKLQTQWSYLQSCRRLFL